MTGTFVGLETALRALRAQQAAVDVTNHNIANANTPGYSRQIAVLQEGGKVLLRAERAGTGNGRVYHVTFMADDGSGGQCTGVVTVCAPHDQGEGNACIDDGQQYNSLQP